MVTRDAERRIRGGSGDPASATGDPASATGDPASATGDPASGPGAALRALVDLGGGFRDLFAAPGANDRSAKRAGAGAEGVASPWGPGPEEARKTRVSGRRRWYAGSLVGLSFLVIMMVQAATGGGSLGEVVAFEVLAVAFGAVYLFAPVLVAGGRAFTGVTGAISGRLGALGSMLAVTVPMIVIGGPEVAAMWIYVGVAGAILLPLRWSLTLAVALAAGMLVLGGLMGADLPWELALTLVALSLWMAGFVGNIRLTVELRATRDELARAAVAAERARIGRDLHDILGHSLTAIAVKAGLARRLAGRDDAAAAAEVADIERLSREALADVRATAAGYRDVSLAAELAVARSVLQAAGIRAELPTAVDDVLPAGREVFGYVVREAVTNVVRHSGAHRCVVELTRTSVTITDDGRGARPSAGVVRPGAGGHGLTGLAERLAAVGGRMQVGSLPGGGFRVAATVREIEAGEIEAGEIEAGEIEAGG